MDWEEAMIRLLFSFWACFFLVFSANLVLNAAEYNVNQDGTGDFVVIQDAIDAALDGDVIVVLPGTYYENIRFDGKNMTLRSLAPEDEEIVATTVIDGGQNDSVVTFLGTEGEDCLLSGFTIINGISDDNNGGGIRGLGTLALICNCTISNNRTGSLFGYGGGGLFDCDGLINNCTIIDNYACEDGGGLYKCDGTISNCTISSNSAADNGGALNGCSGAISNCTISRNSANNGGGLYDCDGPIVNCTISDNLARRGAGLSDCDGTVTNCTISGNRTTWLSGGGLLWCDATISNCEITGNSALKGGGGLFSCFGTIINCTISNNSALEGGGLCSCDGPISGCTIGNNSANDQDGGGLYDCHGMITDCLIIGNFAMWDGGGISGCDQTTISNCTIYGNEANWSGGGVASCDWSAVTNCIIWGNEAGAGDNEIDTFWHFVTVTFSCVRDYAGGGDSNISDDPLFVKGPLGDYYLSCRAAGQEADSRCIDSGTGTAASQGLDEFTTRTDCAPDTGVVDMGYHYPTSLNQNPQIECRLNEREFTPGDTLVGSIEANNPGPTVSVDAYIAFVLPSGALISVTADGLANGTHPWISNVTLPGGSNFGPTEVLWTTTPQSPGDYLFAAALTEPGELDFIGEVHIFPFTILE